MIGETIGNYRITAKLGQGGMGTVYQAEDITLGRRVAVKLLNPTLVGFGSTELERFKAEAKVQANLNNPNVVTLHDFQPYGDSYYMVMEYVEGKTLAELVRTTGALPPPIVVGIAKQILEGLSSAHRIRVVHRDLKPSNIMITPEGLAKVMDFGIAKAVGGKNITATGALVGTVYYMSPEQVRGETLDTRSDLYSFGIILFELLTGGVPFKEESDFSIMIHHVQTPPPPPTQLLPEIPSALEDIVLRCLEKDPDRRYQTAEEIIASLDSFEDQERAMGRAQLYTRRALVHWLGGSPADASLFSASASEPERQSQPDPIIAPAGSTPPAVLSNRQAKGIVDAISPSVKPASARPRGALFAVIAGCLLIAMATAYYYYSLWNRSEISTVSSTSDTSPIAQHAGLTPNTENTNTNRLQTPSDNDEVPTQLPASRSNSVSQPPASSNRTPESMRGVPAPDMPAVPRRQNPPSPSSNPAPAVARSQSTASRPTAEQNRTSRAPIGPPSAAVASDSTPSGALTSPDAPLARDFFISFDLDPSSEPVSLSAAQSRAAEIISNEGFGVVSAGIAPGSARTALEQGDLTGLRRRGIGYVVLATATASLEAQTAYGTVYYTGNVSVTLEVIRTSDGKIAARGSANARSRGLADRNAALNEPLLTATSQGTREMMRRFQP